MWQIDDIDVSMYRVFPTENELEIIQPRFRLIRWPSSQNGNHVSRFEERGKKAARFVVNWNSVEKYTCAMYRRFLAILSFSFFLGHLLPRDTWCIICRYHETDMFSFIVTSSLVGIVNVLLQCLHTFHFARAYLNYAMTNMVSPRDIIISAAMIEKNTNELKSTWTN